jgi:hypothetical protein
MKRVPDNRKSFEGLSAASPQLALNGAGTPPSLPRPRFDSSGTQADINFIEAFIPHRSRLWPVKKDKDRAAPMGGIAFPSFAERPLRIDISSLPSTLLNSSSRRNVSRAVQSDLWLKKTII